MIGNLIILAAMTTPIVLLIMVAKIIEVILNKVIIAKQRKVKAIAQQKKDRQRQINSMFEMLETL